MTNDEGNPKFRNPNRRVQACSFVIRVSSFFRHSSFGLRHCSGSISDWTVGWATLGSPSSRPSPLGRGRMVHRLSITPAPEFSQRPSAKHQSDACCSLSLRERVRVRGKYSVEHANCSTLQELLSIERSLVIRPPPLLLLPQLPFAIHAASVSTPPRAGGVSQSSDKSPASCRA